MAVARLTSPTPSQPSRPARPKILNGNSASRNFTGRSSRPRAWKASHQATTQVNGRSRAATNDLVSELPLFFRIRATRAVGHFLDVNPTNAVDDVLELVGQHRPNLLARSGPKPRQVQALGRLVEIAAAQAAQEGAHGVAGAVELGGPFALRLVPRG